MTRLSDRVLFVGIGGGNDVFSAILAASSLWGIGWRWKSADIAGVLSPFHHHTVYETRFPLVTRIDTSSERSVVHNNGSMRISFVDASVARMVKENNLLKIRTVFGLQLTEGSSGLEAAFRELATEYDFFVLVDIGGDCFYRGPQDTHVLSPMFDAIVLRAFVSSGMQGILFEAGPGTDGELDPEALQEILPSLHSQRYPLDAVVMASWELLYRDYVEPVRTGNTVPATLEAFHSDKTTITRTYRAKAHRGKNRLYHTFEQRINTTLCKEFYLIDPIRVKNPFAVRCNNPYEWFVRTQVEQQSTNCEANLESLRFNGKLFQFLTPSPLFPESDRRAMLEQGIQDFNDRIYDGLWIHEQDGEQITTLVGGHSRIGLNGRLIQIERT